MMVRLFLVLLSVAIFSWSSETRACSCGGGRFIHPVNGQGVPVNMRVWSLSEIGGVSLGPSDRLNCPVLSNSSDWLQLNQQHQIIGSVPFYFKQISPNLSIKVPAVPLQEGGFYRFSGIYESVTVVVSEPADTTPPIIGDVTITNVVSTEGRRSSCGEEYYAVVDVETDGDFVVFDIEGESTFDPVTWCGTLSYAFEASDSFKIVGKSACSNSWDQASRGDELKFRVGSFDLSGNFSGWSKEHKVTLIGCGCRAGENASGSLAWMIAGILGIRFWRKRRIVIEHRR